MRCFLIKHYKPLRLGKLCHVTSRAASTARDLSPCYDLLLPSNHKSGCTLQERNFTKGAVTLKAKCMTVSTLWAPFLLFIAPLFLSVTLGISLGVWMIVSPRPKPKEVDSICRIQGNSKEEDKGP